MAEQWVPDTPELDAWVEGDSGINATIEALANHAADYARSIAPVGLASDGDAHPGQYRDSIDTERNPDGPGWRLFATDHKAHWIEYGAQHMRRYQVLTRAVEQVRT